MGIGIQFGVKLGISPLAVLFHRLTTDAYATSVAVTADTAEIMRISYQDRTLQGGSSNMLFGQS